MRCIQPVHNLNRDVQELAHRQRTPGDQLLQRLPFQQLHDDERLPLPLVNFMNGANVRMIKGRRGPGFPLKPLQRLPVRYQ